MSTELLRERYETLGVVGKGGEGEVVRAVDHQHGRQVALKIRGVSDERSREHLLSEARVLLSLSPHPGLPLVREDFFVDDRYVIAMDWIDGANLEAVVASNGQRGLDPALAIEYLEQAAAALEHLHGHEPPIVHGDVKPANLILTSSGRIVLVDFGLSSTPGDEPRRAGTAGYVAPEVAGGEKPTAASDVYALAATAVTLLTGESPSSGAPSWGSLEHERVAPLERIVRANLATDPERRDPSASAFVARLRRWWGADLPTGTVTLLLVDVSALPGADTEASASEVARVHGGHLVAPLDDGPIQLAFEAPRDGVDAARVLAGAFRARVAVVTGDAELAAGRYRGQPVSTAPDLLASAILGQVVVDDPTAAAIAGRLPAEVGLAKMPDAESGWVVVAPGLETPPRAAICPYRGLMAFGAEDGDVFFGREALVASLLDRLLEHGFLAVVGASGSGKSSLVRAGLLRAFRTARDGPAVVMTPGADPAAALTDALSAGTPALLVVDQLEELFTLCSDEEARARYLEDVMALRTKGTSIVVALRADVYGRCANYSKFALVLAEHQHLLGSMDADELRRAIEGPAQTAGLRLEAGLVDALLADVEGEPGGLPLLSHALYESWERRDGRVLTLAGYRESGGVRGAIAKTADDVFADCTESEQALMRRMFLQLTELGETTEDTRRRVPVAELFAEGEDDAAAALVLERLAESRLLVVDDDSAEIAHEALIREWPRLRGWLTEDREALRAQRQLSAAARSWDEGGREDADLYRGPRLAAAVERAGDQWQVSRLEREFLEAGRTAQERELRAAHRRARRLRALLLVVAAALVVAVIAGLFALVQRGSARRTATVAQAGRIAAQSRQVAAEHPDLGLLLALEAARLDDSVDSRSALLGALEHGSRIRAWIQGFNAPVVASAFNPSGTLLALQTVRATTVWRTSTWTRVGRPLPSSAGNHEGVAFSPDGRTLAITGGDGRVELWDVSTRKEVRELRDPAASAAVPGLAAIHYSPDGKVIAAGGMETNHVTLWDAASGRVLGRPMTTHSPGSGSQSISFSPDSTRIAVPGDGGTVSIWDVATGIRVSVFEIGSEDVEEAIFTRDGRALIVSDDGGAVSLVDAATGQPLRPPLSVGDTIAGALDLSPNGRLMAAASFEGPVFVWDVKTGEPFGSSLTADSSPVSDVVFSPDGRTLVSSHGDSAVVWSMDGSQALGTPLGSPSDFVTDVAFSPDGRRLAAGRLDGKTMVYETRTRRRALRIGGTSVVTAVAFQPSGKLVAVATIDGKVRFFDPRTGAAIGRRLDEGRSPIWQIAFSPDGRLLAVAADPNGLGGFQAQQRDGRVHFWDVASRKRVGQDISPGAGSVLNVAFSDDGDLLATGSFQGRLDLWDEASRARHGRSVKIVDDGVLSVAFDRHDRLVAAGGAIGPVRVWRVADQRPAFPPLTGHTGPVTATAFDSTGSLLATTSLFGGTRLWDPATGLRYGDELVGSPRPGSLTPNVDLPFLALGNAFSPDGKLLAVSGVDTRAMLWSVDPEAWRRRACAIAGRNLTREEWRLYLPAGSPYRATCEEWPTR